MESQRNTLLFSHEEIVKDSLKRASQELLQATLYLNQSKAMTMDDAYFLELEEACEITDRASDLLKFVKHNLDKTFEARRKRIYEESK